MAHELGHSIGLPHSNNSDDDNDPYDSPWTVMSHAFQGFIDPTFGIKGVHLNAHEKDVLGWISANDIFHPRANGEVRRVSLTYLDREQAANGAYRMIELKRNGRRQYTVEARKRGGVYEGIPGTAIIIHSIDVSRNEPAWIVDSASPPADFADTPGVMWQVGEVFTDQGAGISITVVEQTASGFLIDVVLAGNSSSVISVPAIDLLLNDEPG